MPNAVGGVPPLCVPVPVINRLDVFGTFRIKNMVRERFPLCVLFEMLVRFVEVPGK